MSFALPGFRPQTVSLLVGGMLYEGWKKVEVSRSIKEMAGEFSLEVSERFSGGRDGPAVLMGWRIRPGDPCIVLYAGVPVITGYVDVYSPDYDARKHEVKIQGRSKTADLVDSSAESDVPNGEMRNVGLDQLARKLAGAHGIGVKVEAQIKERFDFVRAHPGETKHEMLERYARPGAVALTDDQFGNLRLMHALGGGGFALIEGVNILEASATLRADNRYSDYEVKGQDRGSDQQFGKTVAEIKARVTDGAVKRYRPFVVGNETKTTKSHARNRADWECASRAGESTRAEVTVLDWLVGGAGPLWMPGMVGMLVSPMLAISRPMAVEAVRHSQDEGGTVTQVTLVPPEALKPGGGGASGGSGSDSAWLDTKPTTAAV